VKGLLEFALLLVDNGSNQLKDRVVSVAWVILPFLR
jgi:hypothetical protein